MSEFLYVPNEYDNTVSVIDTADNSVIATIPVEGQYADTAAVSPNGAFVYVFRLCSPRGAHGAGSTSPGECISTLAHKSKTLPQRSKFNAGLSPI
jgi:YVTN family beta-propeller protein